MITRKYIVQGRVQGVGFRYFVWQMAEAFDIAGSVRNIPDGSVEIIATGTPENHRSFKEQVEIGPDGARVDRVTAEEMDVTRFNGFRIDRDGVDSR
jgi:acylphosphatase